MNNAPWSATVRKLYRQRWRIWIVASLAHTVSLFHRAAMAPIADRVMADFDITALAFGSLGAVYFYTYAAMQLPSGTLADTLGPRKTVTAGLFLSAAGSIIMGMAPSFSALYLDFWTYGVEKTGQHIIRDDGLKPERIKTVEAGTEVRFARKVTINITGFYNYAENVMTAPPISREEIDEDDPDIVYEWDDHLSVNKSDPITGSGVEVGIKSQPVKQLDFFANYTYQDVQDKETKKRVAYSPWHIANFGGSVSPVDYLTIAIKAQCVGERVYYNSHTGNAEEPLEAYIISDLNIMTLHNDIELALSVHNLGAKKNYFDTPGYPMPGRSWLMTVGTSF